jgi:hypothetical protein
LLADLKDKEAVAREMIAILRGVRGRDARYDRKAALKVLAKVKQKRVLAEQSLRRTQNRLRCLEAQSAKDSHANIKTTQDRRYLWGSNLCCGMTKIEEHIQVAEKGIRARLQEFSLDHGGTSEENQAIEVAR